MKLFLFVVLCLFSCTQAQVRWVLSSNGNRPVGSIFVGMDRGQQTFLCRMNTRSGFQLAGKLRPPQQDCFVALNGGHQSSRNYDVATGVGYQWVDMNVNRQIPANAVLAGFTPDRTPTYACRGNIDGDILPGNVVQGGPCLIPLNSSEVRRPTYQLLVNP